MKIGDLITNKSKPFKPAICGWTEKQPYKIRFYESGYVPAYESVYERRDWATDIVDISVLHTQGILTEEQKRIIDSILEPEEKE